MCSLELEFGKQEWKFVYSFYEFPNSCCICSKFSLNAHMLISFFLGSAINFLFLTSVLNKKNLKKTNKNPQTTTTTKTYHKKPQKQNKTPAKNFGPLLTIIQSLDHLAVTLLCFVSASTSTHKCAMCIYPKIAGRVLHLHWLSLTPWLEFWKQALSCKRLITLQGKAGLSCVCVCVLFKS